MVIGRMIADEDITDNGNIISLKGFQITYTPEMQRLKEKIEREYREKGVETPETDEFALLFPENERLAVSELSVALRREGRLEKLAYNCYMHIDCFDEAVARLTSAIRENGQITLSEYRDMLDTSRKYAVRILEYLDQQKVTRLVGDARVLNE